MTGFTGTGRLLLFAIRRDRLLLPISLIAMVGWIAVFISSIQSLYPDQAGLSRLAAALADNPALVALIGPTRAIDTLGGLVTWRVGPFMSIAAALLSMFVLVRHTRAEEEDGRTDLILATSTGRFAPLAAASILVAAANLALAAGWFVVLLLYGLGPADSALLAASAMATGIAFLTITAVAVQVAGRARAARGLVGAILAAAYVARAVGDLGDGTLTWLSPLGWAQATHAFSGGRVWPLLIPALVSATLFAAAFSLLARRDLGAGLLKPRAGRAKARTALLNPIGFAGRLQRGSALGWAVGLFISGIAIGAVAQNIESVLDASSAMRSAFVLSGTDVVDSYLATVLTLMALVATGFTIGSALRPRSEEHAQRAELLLSTGLGKIRWASSHLFFSLTLSAVLLTLTGIGMGLGLGIAGAGFDRVGSLAAAGLGNAPAMWVMGGVAVLLFGFSSRAAPYAWGLLAACFVIWTLQSFADLPGWVEDLSPFSHTPLMPAASFDAWPLLAMCAVAATLAAVGLMLWRRRDLV